LAFLEVGWVDTFSGFDAEKEATDGAEYLINVSYFCFIFQVDASVEFRESG
jgi:hypothetical protein